MKRATDRLSLSQIIVNESPFLVLRMGSTSHGFLDTAKLALKDVASRCPSVWTYKVPEGNCLNIKFWDEPEFLHFASWSLESSDSSHEKIYWIGNAYPRAYYYLGLIAVEENDLTAAFAYLHKGRTLEPSNPRFVIEMGQAAMKMRDFSSAAKFFGSVPDVGPHVTGVAKALALRGLGMALIELDDLEKAEAALRLSLQYDPENTTALKELVYISHLRSGGLRHPYEAPQLQKERPKLCSLCGQLFEGGKTYNENGRLRFVCTACLA